MQSHLGKEAKLPWVVCNLSTGGKKNHPGWHEIFIFTLKIYVFKVKICICTVKIYNFNLQIKIIYNPRQLCILPNETLRADQACFWLCACKFRIERNQDLHAARFGFWCGGRWFCHACIHGAAGLPGFPVICLSGRCKGLSAARRAFFSTLRRALPLSSRRGM